MTKTEQLLADLDYLENAGLTEDQLRSLHHWSNRPEAAARVTFASARDYFGHGRDMKTNNSSFADRLRLVVTQHCQATSRTDPLTTRDLTPSDLVSCLHDLLINPPRQRRPPPRSARVQTSAWS